MIITQPEIMQKYSYNSWLFCGDMLQAIFRR